MKYILKEVVAKKIGSKINF